MLKIHSWATGKLWRHHVIPAKPQKVILLLITLCTRVWNTSVKIGCVHRYEYDRSNITSLRDQERVEKAKVQCPESLKYDIMKDDAISNGDVTMLDVNKPIARKRYIARKRSLMYSGGSTKSSLRAFSHTIAKSTLFLAIVVSLLGGVFNIKLPGWVSLVGNSSSLSPPQPCVTLSCSDSSVIFSLRTFSANIINGSNGLWSCINIGRILDNNNRTERCIGIIRSTIRCEERGCIMSSSARGQECEKSFRLHNRHFQLSILRVMLTVSAGLWPESGSSVLKQIFHKKKQQISRNRVMFNNTLGNSFRLVIVPPSCYATREYRTFPGNVFGRKPFGGYIIFLAVVCAIRLSGFSSHTLNLDDRYRYNAFNGLKYIYMNAFWYSWLSCNLATYVTIILYTLVYFSSNPFDSVRKSHNKYQSTISIGLALMKKAYVGLRCFLPHYRSYWEEWRTLVTPWARCIKEGIEPWTPPEVANHFLCPG